MQADEQAIRDLVATWMRASAAGDAEGLIPLMAEDVVFLLPGQPPMRGRDAFIAAMREGFKQIRMEATSDIQEIHVFGDLAYCWNHLSVTITPRAGSASSKRRSGYVLSVLRKDASGKWVISRDANLLTEEKSAAS